MTTTLPASCPPTDQTSAAVAVELREVTKRYSRRAAPAIDRVSAVFPPATLTAIMGLSGSGKSTLLQCAAGLDKPSSGRVLLGDVDLTRLRRRTLAIVRRRAVGFVFQSFNLVPTLTVAENIALPLRLDRRRVDRADLVDLADRVGVAGLLRRLPHTLSGGQQQRVALARALITRPAVIFADEPTAALDPHTSHEIRTLLRAAVDELGQTVVLVTHEPGLAAAADRALLLHHGQLVADIGRPHQDDLLRRLRYLGQVG